VKWPWRRRLCSGTYRLHASGPPLTCPVCGRGWDTEGTIVPRHHITPSPVKGTP
jgi:hypothetical protein